MDRQRRRLLKFLSASSLGAIAGCNGLDNSDTETETDNQSLTDKPSSEATQTPTTTLAPTPTNTPTQTSTPTNTPTQTSTPTNTPTQTSTPTNAPTQTSTRASTSDPSDSPRIKLGPGNGDGSYNFGSSIAIDNDGTTVVIGAPSDVGPNGENVGSAYVFTRNGGSWTQQARLLADDGEERDLFGRSVALSSDGSTTIISTINDEGPEGESTGSAYVFTRNDESWTQQTKLIANDGNKDDDFGKSLTLSGDGSTIIIGAPLDAGPDSNYYGSAYVFSRSNGTWTQEAKLTANEGSGGDIFGRSVGVTSDGSKAFIGVPGWEAPDTINSGAVFVFSRGSESWTQQSKIIPNDVDKNDYVGESLSVTGDGSTLVIGSDNDDDPNGEEAGSAYVLSRSNGTWAQDAKLAAVDGDSGDSFSSSVAITNDGSTILIGAEEDEDPNGKKSGSAYLFTQEYDSWTQQTKFVADDGDSRHRFGGAVSLGGNGGPFFIGAKRSGLGGSRTGLVYVFE